MTVKLKNENNEEVEVLTEEEVEAEKKKAADEAIERYKQDNPEDEEITDLKKQLDEANVELEKFKGKDLNFSNLRKQKVELEKKIEEINAGVDAKIKGVIEGINKEVYDETINNLAGGDDELKKKIEINYKRIVDPSDSKLAIQKKLRDAYVMSTGVEVPNFAANGFSSAGAPINKSMKSGEKPSSDLIELGKKMGVSEEDWKKVN